MQAGGLAGAVFNAAKESALDGFIEGRIGFLEMAGIVDAVLAKMAGGGHMVADTTLENVLLADQEARRLAVGEITSRQS